MALRSLMLALFCVLANPVYAAGTADSSSCSSHLCLRPQGCAHCGSAPLIWVYAGPGTEISGVTSGGNWKLGVEVGYLTNINERHAWGATLFVLYWNQTGNRFGARVVYRRWLSSQVGLDLAPGIVVYANEQEWPAFSGHVALDLAGLVAPMAQIDMIRMDDRVHWSLMGGVRVGGYLGIAAGVLVGLAAIGYATESD